MNVITIMTLTFGWTGRSPGFQSQFVVEWIFQHQSHIQQHLEFGNSIINMRKHRWENTQNMNITITSQHFPNVLHITNHVFIVCQFHSIEFDKLERMSHKSTTFANSFLSAYSPIEFQHQGIIFPNTVLFLIWMNHKVFDTVDHTFFQVNKIMRNIGSCTAMDGITLQVKYINI